MCVSVSVSVFVSVCMCMCACMYVTFEARGFCKCQFALKAGVDKAREDCILKVSNTAESAMSKGMFNWNV